MTATIVEIKEKKKHPNADSLFVYKVSNNFDIESIQVIANSENLYEVGDSAVYISPNSEMFDGLRIKSRKIRGINSFGMLAGFSDQLVGTDVSGHWCKEPELTVESTIEKTNLTHQKWTSLESLAHVRKTVISQKNYGVSLPYHNCIYASKVKLHGTNAGVQIAPDGAVAAQKRSSVIYPDQDNCGFGAWVASNKEYFASIADEHDTITLHGEWVGPKIQKGVAVSNLKEKVFVIFALQYGSVEDDTAYYVVSPKKIQDFVGEGPCMVLPWYSVAHLNFNDSILLADASNTIAAEVLKVEARDPWAYNNFGIEGIGEGLVYYPLVEQPLKASEYKQFIFKAKGEKHQVSKHKSKLVPIDIEKLENVNEFVSKFVTVPRLEQGLFEAVNNEFDTKLIGQFLKWVNNDVEKESQAELEASDSLTWNDVRKQVMTKARLWYQDKINN